MPTYAVKTLYFFVCCIFMFLPTDSVRRYLLDNPRRFIAIRCFVVGRIHTCSFDRTPTQYKSFQRSNVPRDFFKFFTEFAACLNPPSRIINVFKQLIQGRKHVTQVWVEPPDRAIRVVVKTTPLPTRLRCRLQYHKCSAVT